MGFPAQLPDELITEFGQIVWMAINLEDVTYFICHAVKPRELFDDTPIGTRINQAEADLGELPECESRQRAMTWLERAKEALEARNAVVHSTHVVSIEGGSEEAGPGSEGQCEWLIHFPRRRDKPAIHTPLTVDALREVRTLLESAIEGWQEAGVEAYQLSRQARGVERR